MQRRDFVRALLPAAASLALPAQAQPADASIFAARVAQQPLLTPLLGVTDLSGDVQGTALLRGRWPRELRGRFYRNGPALLQRGAERYHHWFDGDGMVQQFSLGDAGVSHRGRLVRTSKLQAEQKAGRFLFDAFGTSVPGRATGGGPDSYNTANTNAIEHAGRVLALWEGGSAYALDPQDLSTQGPVTWGKDMAQLPFSAHPKVDAQGQLWNIGAAGKHLLVWHVGADGQLKRLQMTESPFADGMVHDMAVTERYLVVPLPPVRLNFAQGRGDGPKSFAMVAAEPLRVLVMEKADIQRRRVFELPPQMVFHIGNAHEESGGSVVLSFVGAPDAGFLNEGAVALMAARPHQVGRSELQVVRLQMGNGRTSVQTMAGQVEFPRMDPRRIARSGGEHAQWLVTTASWHSDQGGQQALMHGLQISHLKSGRSRRFDYGAHTVVEEHVLVPKPGKTGELDAWLLGTTFDSRRQATVLNVLDAAHIEDGPVAQAVLPYLLPLGFHGNFSAA